MLICTTLWLAQQEFCIPFWVLENRMHILLFVSLKPCFFLSRDERNLHMVPSSFLSRQLTQLGLLSFSRRNPSWSFGPLCTFHSPFFNHSIRTIFNHLSKGMFSLSQFSPKAVTVACMGSHFNLADILWLRRGLIKPTSTQWASWWGIWTQVSLIQGTGWCY